MTHDPRAPAAGVPVSDLTVRAIALREAVRRAGSGTTGLMSVVGLAKRYEHYLRTGEEAQ